MKVPVHMHAFRKPFCTLADQEPTCLSRLLVFSLMTPVMVVSVYMLLNLCSLPHSNGAAMPISSLEIFSYQATLKEGNSRCNAFFQEAQALCAIVRPPQTSLLSGKSFVNSNSGYEGPLSSAATKCNKNRGLHFQATRHSCSSPEEQQPEARRKGW